MLKLVREIMTCMTYPGALLAKWLRTCAKEIFLIQGCLIRLAWLVQTVAYWGWRVLMGGPPAILGVMHWTRSTSLTAPTSLATFFGEFPTSPRGRSKLTCVINDHMIRIVGRGVVSLNALFLHHNLIHATKARGSWLILATKASYSEGGTLSVWMTISFSLITVYWE